jgi:hypothetical protein
MAEIVTFLKYFVLPENEKRGRRQKSISEVDRGLSSPESKKNRHVLFHPRAFSKVKIAEFASLWMMRVKLVDLIAWTARKERGRENIKLLRSIDARFQSPTWR